MEGYIHIKTSNRYPVPQDIQNALRRKEEFIRDLITLKQIRGTPCRYCQGGYIENSVGVKECLHCLGSGILSY